MTAHETHQPDRIESFLKGMIVVVTLAALMWFVEIVNAVLFGQSLNRFGILPRVGSGLAGIAFAPLLHASFAHLISNTVPFLVLGTLVAARGLREFFVVTALAWLASGLGAWLLGAGNSFHVGMSGVIFGYFAFLVLRGFFERKLVSIAVAVLVAVTYGGILVGLNPFAVHVSWTGHLFGMVGGGVAAFLLRD